MPHTRSLPAKLFSELLGTVSFISEQVCVRKFMDTYYDQIILVRTRPLLVIQCVLNCSIQIIKVYSGVGARPRIAPLPISTSMIYNECFEGNMPSRQ